LGCFFVLSSPVASHDDSSTPHREKRRIKLSSRGQALDKLWVNFGVIKLVRTAGRNKNLELRIEKEGLGVLDVFYEVL